MDKNNISRITIDLPQESHKKLKIMSTLLGKSMRSIIIEAVDAQLEILCDFTNCGVPNKETIQAIKQVEKRIDLIKSNNLEDLFKKLDI